MSSRAVPGPLFTCRNAARPVLAQLSGHALPELAAVASTLLPALFFPLARRTRGRLLPPVGHVLRPPAAAQPRLVLTLLQAQGRGKLGGSRLEGDLPGGEGASRAAPVSPALATGRGLVGREDLGRLHRSLGGKSPMGSAASRVERRSELSTLPRATSSKEGRPRPPSSCALKRAPKAPPPADESHGGKLQM